VLAPKKAKNVYHRDTMRDALICGPRLLRISRVRSQPQDGGERSKEGDAMKGKSGGANKAPVDKVSALRSALRSAPRKVEGRSRSPLKAAVAQLLPDLLAFRAKGYSDAELAGVMRESGFVIAASTLRKYINEARARSPKARRRKAEKVAPARTSSKAITVESGARTVDVARTVAALPSLFTTKPLAQNRRAAKDVLGHRFDDDV
jgi:hypothetical protein